MDGAPRKHRIRADKLQPAEPSPEIRSSREGWKNDGYVQQSSALFGGRVNLAGGLRIDTAALFDVHPLSPQISAAWQVAPATQLQLAVGRYHQFYFPATIPTILSAVSPTCSQSIESLEAANHYIAAIEQRLGESARVKLLLFDRNDDESVAQSISGGCPPGFVSRGFQTLERDYSRGAQIVLQSRNANRLSGWIGYTLTCARQGFYNSNAGLNSLPPWSPYYPTVADQRHTLNLFANYRLTPTLNLGGKFLFAPAIRCPPANTTPFGWATISGSMSARKKTGPSGAGSLRSTESCLTRRTTTIRDTFTRTTQAQW